MTRALLAASVVLALAVSTPALAQGKSQQGKNTAPPSRNELTPVAPMSTSPTRATPLAWIDDASLLAPGMVALSVSAMRWQGGGLSEVDAPIVDAAFGLAPRVQLSASVPRVVGSADPAGAAGGVGTSFFSAKIAVYEAPKHAFKVATAPTLQLLGKGIVQSLGSQQSRVRWGLPVSAEVSSGTHAAIWRRRLLLARPLVQRRGGRLRRQRQHECERRRQPRVAQNGNARRADVGA